MNIDPFHISPNYQKVLDRAAAVSRHINEDSYVKHNILTTNTVTYHKSLVFTIVFK